VAGIFVSLPSGTLQFLLFIPGFAPCGNLVANDAPGTNGPPMLVAGIASLPLGNLLKMFDGRPDNAKKQSTYEGIRNRAIIETQMLGHESITTTEIYIHMDRNYLRQVLLGFKEFTKQSGALTGSFLVLEYY